VRLQQALDLVGRILNESIALRASEVAQGFVNDFKVFIEIESGLDGGTGSD